MGLNNRWMAAFLSDVGKAVPELKPELRRAFGAGGPYNLDAIDEITQRGQQLIGSGDVECWSKFVAVLDLYDQPDHHRLRRFNAIVEQFWFDSWSFNNARHGRVAWMILTPKLRRRYKWWIVEGLGFSWAAFAPRDWEDLPDT